MGPTLEDALRELVRDEVRDMLRTPDDEVVRLLRAIIREELKAAARRAPDPSNPPTFFKVGSLEKRLGVNRRTINRWVRAGELPRPVWHAGHRVWPQETVLEWERGRTAA
jgi:predicted DNA-binding transcriptional regulator AlpA